MAKHPNQNKPPVHKSASMMTSAELRKASQAYRDSQATSPTAEFSDSNEGPFAEPAVKSATANPTPSNADPAATVLIAADAPTHDPKHIPVLMSAANPNGWKLEELLRQLVLEISDKNRRIKVDQRPEAVLVHNNNSRIIEMLRDCDRLQSHSLATLDALRPNEGPLGKPRIGEGSE